MNLVHLKYAVEVAETGSINKASEKLYVSQPNLSRAIKELEASRPKRKGNGADTGRRGFCSLRTLDTPSGRRYRRSVQQGYDREEKILDIRAEGELCDRRIRRVLKASRQGHAG